ncbi:hypothetical protein HPB49_026496 [Dermacentor silvarum]|nr:hypothetical protein HPB49_026496 [Dermacentor silvarum]
MESAYKMDATSKVPRVSASVIFYVSLQNCNMKHVLVKWETEDTWDVYPVKSIADVAIGMELLRDPASALQKFRDVVVDIVWQPGKPPAPARILAVGSQASMEKKRNRLALEAAETDSSATGAKRTCDHLEQIESLQNTVESLQEELRETRAELAQARQCIGYTTRHFNVLPGQLKNTLSSLLARGY